MDPLANGGVSGPNSGYPRSAPLLALACEDLAYFILAWVG